MTFKHLTLIPFLLFYMNIKAQNSRNKFVSKNNMTVNWQHIEDEIIIEMSAPTTGWVTIGFNTHSGIQGTYLIMGRVEQGQAEVVEHYTLAPGDYQTIQALGAPTQVSNVSGKQSNNQTTLRFSLHITRQGKYQKDLSEGGTYQLIMAFSQADDFQHHSIMRTSLKIKL